MENNSQAAVDSTDGARKSKKRWSDLSPAARIATVLGGAVEIVVTTMAIIDLLRRPADQVRGRKLSWLFGFSVQPFGPLLYFAFGRRTTTR